MDDSVHLHPQLMLFDGALRDKALVILRREQNLYGTFDLSHQRGRDSFVQLIKTMLSHRTTHADEKAAFDNMWTRYGSWEAIQQAETAELTELLAPARYPEVKARNIKRTLAQIMDERGAYNIDFLADIPTHTALDWLMSLPGVGIKTASLVLLFQFQKPVMPVDTHVYRVSKRVGLITPKTTTKKAHTRLLELLPNDPATLYNFHRATLTHGQQVCHYYDPKCEACPLRDMCDAYNGENDAIANP